jgi:hypothetical protein
MSPEEPLEYQNAIEKSGIAHHVVFWICINSITAVLLVEGLLAIDRKFVPWSCYHDLCIIAIISGLTVGLFSVCISFSRWFGDRQRNTLSIMGIASILLSMLLPRFFPG